MDLHKPIIDSALSFEEAVRDNPAFPAPEWLRNGLVVLELQYWSYDGQVHQGQLVVHRAIEGQVKSIFQEMFDQKIPIAKMVTISVYSWDDEASMQDNNCSAYNYRNIAGTDELSFHALGLAIDIDPRINPYIEGDSVQPRGAVYDPSVPGTLTRDSALVQIFKKHGFDWGGDWMAERGYVDYQHFSFLHWSVDGVEWLRSQGW